MVTASSRLFKVYNYELTIFKQAERKHRKNKLMYSTIELAAKYSFMTCGWMNFKKAAIFVFFHYIAFTSSQEKINGLCFTSKRRESITEAASTISAGSLLSCIAISWIWLFAYSQNLGSTPQKKKKSIIRKSRINTTCRSKCVVRKKGTILLGT